MKVLRCILLLQFAVTLAVGQPAQPRKQPGLFKQPEELVQSLYQQVLARHPHDIPSSAEMKIFAPYLSKALLHRIDLAKACSADWDRQNPEPHLKSKIASWYGLFSGESARAEPRAFKIKRTQPEKDGSLRVYVNLTGGKTFWGEWNWRVAAVVLREDGHHVIDDVIYINDNTYDKPENKPADRRLSEYLSAGCDGPNWIGHSLPNQPEPLIQSLYQHVVARPPSGIPSGADWKIFAPYMSKTLLHRIDVFLACAEDWDRQDRERMLKDPIPNKAPFGVYESGIFSGGDERTEPGTFRIERTESKKDGTFRVYVRLTWEEPPDKEIWRVAAILVREDGRLVVDDVIYLKDEKREWTVDYRLSEVLSAGCDGPRWVGDRAKKSNPKQ